MDRELNKSSRLQDGSHEIESNQTEKYRAEFPDFKLGGDMAGRPIVIPDGFRDASWHNDSCPHWEKELSSGLVLDIWIDCEETDERELPDASRYLAGVRQASECEYDVQVLTNDWRMVLDFVTTHGENEEDEEHSPACRCEACSKERE